MQFCTLNFIRSKYRNFAERMAHDFKHAIYIEISIGLNSKLFFMIVK